MVTVNICKFFELIKFSHTVFALPFALISAILSLHAIDLSLVSPETWKILAWIILAMVGARSGAMGFNRLVDIKWDKANPRTVNRPSATGEISPIAIIIMVLLSLGLLVFAAWNLNPLAFKLSPVAIFLICFYSYTKRFSSYSHFFLGLAIGSAPVASWIAVSGSISVTPLVIGFSVLTWIAGFDVLYALQDIDFDQKVGLHSIPVKFGISKSLIFAKLLHLITVVCWILLVRLEQLHWIFILGIVGCSGLLIWEHSLLKKDDLSKLNMAFFNMNAIISVTMFVSLTLDILFF